MRISRWPLSNSTDMTAFARASSYVQRWFIAAPFPPWSFDEHALYLSSRLGMRKVKLLHVFVTMFDDSFRSFIHVVTRLKEPFI